MKIPLILFLLVLAPQFVFLQSKKDECLTCHETLGDKPSELFKRDVHFEIGISCAGCHGGDDKTDDMDAAMSKQKGYIGVPKGDNINTVCAKCHSDAQTMVKTYKSYLQRNQSEMLATSVHGKLSTSGKEHIVQCSTCHNAHGIVSTKNPASPVHPSKIVKTCTKCHSDAAFMRKYKPKLPVDQLDKYRTSIHGMKNARGDVKVAQCASCHGSHDIRASNDVKSKVYAENLPETCGKCHANSMYMKGYGIPTDQLKKFNKSVHGKALLEKHDTGAPACNDCHGNHGAVPLGVESISNVCGTCHALNADLFSSSPHKIAFDRKKFPECETCHGYHDIVSATDELLGVSSEAVCSRCHQEDQNTKGYAAAKIMRQLIDSLEHLKNEANSLIDDAEQKGMEISESKFKLREINQSRLQSRTMVHAFDVEKLNEVVGKGLSVASVVKSDGQKAIDEYYYRRWGLGVASVIITILAMSLYLTIRRIEKSQENQS